MVSAKRRGISRREFLSRGVKAGISFSALGMFLSSCAVTGEQQAGRGSAPISIAINQSPWLKSFQSIVDIYKEDTGNDVNLRIFPFEGLRSKLLNAASIKSEEFDLYTINEGWAAQFYDAGFVTPMQDIDPDFELDGSVIEYDSVTRWDKSLGYFSKDGPVYGIPINGNIQLLYYRRDLYDEMGLEPPETWDDVIAATKEARRKLDSNIYGYTMRGKPGGYAVLYDYLPLLRGFGGDIFANPPEDYSVTINSDEGRQAVELFLELLSYGPPEPQAIGQADQLALMQSGRTLQTHTPNGAFPLMDDEVQSSVPDKIGYTVVPRPSEGVHAPTGGIWVMGIPQHIQSSQKEAAYSFLQWLLAKENHLRYAESSGIATRQDVYESDLAEQEKFRYMRATAASSPYVTRGADYVFGSKVHEVAERRLSEIAAGLLQPKDALDTMADEIAKVVPNS